MRTGIRWLFFFILFAFSGGAAVFSQPSDSVSLVFYARSFNSYTFESEIISLPKQLQGKNFQLQYFYLDWNEAYGGAFPTSSLSRNLYFELRDINFTPNITINKRVFQLTPSDELPELARRTSEKISAISEPFGDHLRSSSRFYNTSETKEKIPVDQSWRLRIKSINVDCDWDKATRDRYFLFLTLLQKYFPGIALTCTIRQQQFRERKTLGVPPLSRAIFFVEKLNLNPTDLRRLFRGAPYPLSLDVQLPLWNWLQWYRDDQLLGAFYWHPERYYYAKRFLSNAFYQEDSTGFQILRDTTVEGVFLQGNDQLRNTPPDSVGIQQFFKALNQKNKVANRRVILMDWDDNKIKAYARLLQNLRQVLR
jgi:hypothetical protein